MQQRSTGEGDGVRTLLAPPSASSSAAASSGTVPPASASATPSTSGSPSSGATPSGTGGSSSSPRGTTATSSRTTPAGRAGGVAARPASGRVNVGIAFTDLLPNMSPAARASDLRDVAALHAGWIRMDLAWRGVQPTAGGPFTWERYDPTVQAARAQGLNVLMILGQAPEWARDPSCADQLFCPPASNEAYAAFARAATAHYAGLGVTTFEIWNEPNMTYFWVNPDATRYGRLLLAAADAVHAANPRAKVLVGGLAAAAGGLPILDQVAFLSDICATGACDRIDGVGYHPYTYPLTASARPSWATPWTRMSLTQPSLRSVLVAAGRGEVPFWLTEFGAPTNGPGQVSNGGPDAEGQHTDHVTEALQAHLATDALATAAADSRIAAIFWHQHQDNPDAGGAIESSYGLRRADGSAKPAWAAFADAAATVSAE